MTGLGSCRRFFIPLHRLFKYTAQSSSAGDRLVVCESLWPYHRSVHYLLHDCVILRGKASCCSHRSRDRWAVAVCNCMMVALCNASPEEPVFKSPAIVNGEIDIRQRAEWDDTEDIKWITDLKTTAWQLKLPKCQTEFHVIGISTGLFTFFLI